MRPRIALPLLFAALFAMPTATFAQGRGWLGFALSCSSCSWETIQGRDVLRFTSSPVIENVDPSGPARAAGLQPGDVIVRLDGRALTDPAGASRLAQAGPGDALEVEYRRDGRTRTTRLVVGERASQQGLGGLAEAVRSAGAAISRSGRRPDASSAVRFRGDVGGMGVEVRGAPDIMVILREGECDAVIVTATARVTLTGPATCRRR